LDELKRRIDQSRSYIESIPPDQINGAENRQIEQSVRGTARMLTGKAYLSGFVLPNLYFHSTAAYAILRHCGVELGKLDFLGSIDC
jgi:hypothetical protein